ncbi:MAG: hypothetical protein ACHQD9_00295 [Chitinophagales bacterium]
MKNKSVVSFAVVLLIIACIIVAYFKFYSPELLKGTCDVPKMNKDGFMTCPQNTCTGTCQLQKRKKGSDNPWTNGTDAESDTARFEYKCTCIK